MRQPYQDILVAEGAGITHPESAWISKVMCLARRNTQNRDCTLKWGFQWPQDWMWHPSMRIWERDRILAHQQTICDFKLWWGNQSWYTRRSRKHGKVKNSEEKCYLNYLGAGEKGEECISNVAQPAWAAESFMAGPHPTHPHFFWALPFSFKDSSFLLMYSQDGEQRPCPPTAWLPWADTALWPYGFCRPDPASPVWPLTAGRVGLHTCSVSVVFKPQQGTVSHEQGRE